MNAYFRLMRLHQPTGIWLLLWPCWWAIALASRGQPSLRLLALFSAGAIVMRAAGCIINDIADREFDRRVERTRTRPLASGEIAIWQAILLLAALLCVALVIALQLPLLVLKLAAMSLVLVVAYPFMKRITWWPQAFLGLTFNFGALMGWAAVQGKIAWPAVCVYLGGICWTLGYDTIYAHQDKADDTLIGVKSTALRWGKHGKLWIGGFYALAILGWALAGWICDSGWPYYAGIAVAAAHAAWQVYRVDLDDTASCLTIFRSNAVLGALVFVGMCWSKF